MVDVFPSIVEPPPGTPEAAPSPAPASRPGAAGPGAGPHTVMAAVPPRRPDRFPDATAQVQDMLQGGREPEAIRFVMSAYRPALAAYFTKSSFRWRLPADESGEGAVDQFFADQLGRGGFLTAWTRAGSRFRYWLLVSFANHLRHRIRGERSEERRRERLRARVEADPGRRARDEVRDTFDAESARGLVREAMRLAGEACAADGRGDDWRTFLAHVVDDRPFAELASEAQLTLRQIENRMRFARRRFRDAMERLMNAEGCRDETRRNAEYERMLEAMSRCQP